MRFSLCLLTLAAASGVTASSCANTDYFDPAALNADVATYLNSLTPVAKQVLVQKLGGPAIGADVNLYYFSSRFQPQHPY
jgi:hypothetical protein